MPLLRAKDGCRCIRGSPRRHATIPWADATRLHALAVFAAEMHGLISKGFVEGWIERERISARPCPR
ncbi:MAG: hypothetical protein O2955_20005 [Planctomycetota bacterium]|nr:hypothetical protein [Planctomycetota bacterium]MDA1214798.1 hypothetical protein [Planctomycetota bacterium]